ncbi:MAG: AI-2E family transporter, partial [Clostridia bacterium]|nr:AI-2E family transporter [Clostridia bacterium]
MNNSEKRSGVISWKNCIRIGVCAFVLFLCIYYWSAISAILATVLGAATPVVIGFAIAYVLNILMSFYEKHYFKKSKSKIVNRTRRPVCLVGAIVSLLLVITAIVLLVVPELVECVKFLIAEIPPLIEELLDSKLVKELVPKDILSTLAEIDWMSNITKLIETISSGIGDAVTIVVNAVTSAVSVIVTGFLSIIFSLYLLGDRDKLFGQTDRIMKAYVPEKARKKIAYTLSVFDECFHNFIVGQCIEAVIIGVLCTLGMWLFRFPYAPMVGALVGFTALIPVAGAYVGAAVGAVMMLTESPVKALLFLIFIIILQQLEGNLIYPKVVGNSVGLPAIWV